MNQGSRQRAVCFADVCGSTRIYEMLGDEAAQSVIGGALELMARVVAEHGGEVVKTVGDEVMAAFDQPADALAAAQAMQRAVSQAPPAAPGAPPVMLHSGVHWGAVVATDGDLFGDAVNVAARLTALAKPGQVLTTQPTLHAAGPDAAGATRLVSRMSLKGKARQVEVYELLWDAGGVTCMVSSPLAAGAEAAQRLVLQLGGLALEVHEGRPQASLGRDSRNDLIVTGEVVSRHHARVELRQGRFVLVDQSTNGTFLSPNGGEGQYLRLKEAFLEGGGRFYLGRRHEADTEEAVVYRVV